MTRTAGRPKGDRPQHLLIQMAFSVLIKDAIREECAERALANLLLVSGLDAVLLEYAGEVEAKDVAVVF